MSNITLSVDDEVIRKVRKIAVNKNTTLTQIVRDFLTSVATRGAAQRWKIPSGKQKDLFEEICLAKLSIEEMTLWKP